MEEIANLWIETCNRSSLTRLFMLSILFFAITGFVIYLYVFLISIYAIIRTLHRRYIRAKSIQEMREQQAEQFTSFISNSSSRRGRDSSLYLFLRNWFAYDNDASPEVPRRMPSRIIMSPKSLLGRSTGLSTIKNDRIKRRVFEDNKGFEELVFESSKANEQTRIGDENPFLNAYDRVNLSVIDEVDHE
ncbi:unnamed protein product [Bursaphelenchus xylophilus]|uniref:(pine wood nematode) hypothetical protein n=1 Tax=Bursaphelenchus xylophilus TaxID=6326 RepID=A0A1I7RR41_BURXY|nr:unnamed protein product [Bursaphelenchus xylophilus]CAG9130832.1 unnamed protein product [Bursaphelenchus xylophilus]